MHYALHPVQWGQGYTKEIIPEMLAFGFNSPGVNRIHADTDPRNLASIKILLKAGFKKEGRFRENWIHPGEDPTDTILLGLIKSDWDRIKHNKSHTGR